MPVPVGLDRKQTVYVVNVDTSSRLLHASGLLSQTKQQNSAQHLESSWLCVPSFWLRWFELQQFWFDRSLCRERILGRNQRDKICRVPARVPGLPSNEGFHNLSGHRMLHLASSCNDIWEN